MTGVLLALSQSSPVFLPGILTTSGKGTRLLFGIAWGLAAGFFEELGWNGFAAPRLKLRHSLLTTGLVVGVLWGAWHVLTNAFCTSSTYAGSVSRALFLAATGFSLLLGQLPAYRVLMVWVYDRTGSLPVVMLMHASLTATTLIVGPVDISGARFLTYVVVLSAAQWLVVAALAAANRRQLRENRAGGPVQLTNRPGDPAFRR